MRGMFRHIFQEVHKNSGAKVVGVEVGVCYGLNAFQCLVCFPNLTLHLVDQYKRHDSRIAKEAAEYILAPFNERIIFHVKTSEEAAQEFADGLLDFVYIDAEHDYDSVMRDIKAWLPKVKKDNGVIGGHDFYVREKDSLVFSLKNGVVNAVCKSFPLNTITTSISPGDWWVDIKDL